jgi:hypothetical protein
MRSFALVSFALALACSSAPTNDDRGGPARLDTSVYDNCVDFATRLCEDSAGCCQTAYSGFDLDGCVDTFKRDVCRPGADAVMAGRASFDEEAVEGCLSAHAEAHEICIPTWQQTVALRKRIYTACRVIDGKSPPGSGCSISATCKHPAGEASVACIKNVCQAIEVLDEGAECPFPSGPVSVCDDGLTCDAPGPGVTGHCVKAPSTCDACDASTLESTECGLGSYCDAGSETCRRADNFGGSGCSQGTECVSFDCDRIANSCAAAPAVLSRAECLGTPQTP